MARQYRSRYRNGGQDAFGGTPKITIKKRHVQTASRMAAKAGRAGFRAAKNAFGNRKASSPKPKKAGNYYYRPR